MTVQTFLSESGRELTIKINGRFDFSSHQEFRDAYEDTQTQDRVATYIIDMNGTSYLDSSALGMLLLLRDYAGGENADIQIVNCNQDVRKILTISNFDQLFVIR